MFFFATALEKGIWDWIARVLIIRVYGSPHSRDSYHLPIPNICVDAGSFGCGPEAVWRIHVLRYIMARCGKIGGCRVGVPRRVEL